MPLHVAACDSLKQYLQESQNGSLPDTLTGCTVLPGHEVNDTLRFLTHHRPGRTSEAPHATADSTTTLCWVAAILLGWLPSVFI